MILRNILLMASLLALVASSGANPDALRRSMATDPEAAEPFLEMLREEHDAAHRLATRRGLPVRGADSSTLLHSVADGRPLYLITQDQNQAISIGANVLRDSEPYLLGTTTMPIGIWDSGRARPTHQELVGRVESRDSSLVTTHATSVTGIAAASGVIFNAQGHVPNAAIWSQDWSFDQTEVFLHGAMNAFDTNGVLVTNHSYGEAAGWQFGNYSGFSGPHWFGEWGKTPPTESDLFGLYSSNAANWDAVLSARPYVLTVFAAGNERVQGAPQAGTTFYYYQTIEGEFVWQSAAYDPAIHPGADWAASGGYDTIATIAIAKNIVTVGAMSSAVLNGQRSVETAVMTGFSSWGPADDGRIKPDVVAQGFSVTTIGSASDTNYLVGNGTSYAAPSVSGAALLLQEHHRRLFEGRALRASSLKGLLIHTADDITSPTATYGPDASTGWGYVNALAAAQLLDDHATTPGSPRVLELALNTAQMLRRFEFQWNEFDPIRVTICWTDPAGVALTGLNNRTPALVNDLDLRITDPEGSVHYPWRLDAENPAAGATRGDNMVDPVEAIWIESPIAGTYTVDISHKGNLAGASQAFSMIVTGLVNIEEIGESTWYFY